MKQFIGVAVLLALAVVVRFIAFPSFGVDISIHDTYWVVPLRKIGFWGLIVIAAVWFLQQPGSMPHQRKCCAKTRRRHGRDEIDSLHMKA